MIRYYLISVFGDVEPSLLGPFVTSVARDNAAKEHRASDPNQRDGIYWLNVPADGALEIGAYPGSLFEDNEV